MLQQGENQEIGDCKFVISSVLFSVNCPKLTGRQNGCKMQSKSTIQLREV